MKTDVVRPRMYRRRHRPLYAAGMTRRVILGIQDFRLRLKARIDVLEQGEETIVQKRGKVVGALVPIEWYRQMREQSGDPTEL